MVDMTLEVPKAGAPRVVQQLYRMKLAVNKCLKNIDAPLITKEAKERQQKKANALMAQIEIFELEAKAATKRVEQKSGVNIQVPLGRFGLSPKTPE